MNAEQFDLWLNNPTTIEYFNAIKMRLREERRKLASGWHLKTNAADTAQSYAQAVGACKAFNDVLDVYEFTKANQSKGDRNGS